MKIERTHPLLLAILFLCSFSGDLFSQQVTPKERRFVVIRDGAKLQVDSKVAGSLGEGVVIQVDAINGEWLWMTSRKAYIAKADALPLPDAIELYSKRIAEAKDSKAVLQRAKLLRIQGKIDDALADVKTALQKGPDVETLMLQGVLLHDKREFDQAIASYNEALKLAGTLKTDVNLPDVGLDRVTTSMVNARALLLNNRGWAQCEKGDYAAALSDFDRASLVDPKYARAIYNRGLTLERKGDFDKAIESFAQVLKSIPNHADSYNSRGRVRFAKEQYDEALADFEAAIKLDILHPQAYANRRSVWYKKGEFEKMEQELEATAKKPEPSNDALNSLAWFRATCPEDRFRNGKQAVELATKICQATELKDPGLLDTLAASFAEAGSFEKAVEAERRAIAIAPANRKADYEARLAVYQKKEPYRTPR